MIRVERGPEPAALGQRDKKENKSERERVLDSIAELRKQGHDPSQLKFDFGIYKHEDVKRALHEQFRGKCAYCEARYRGTQPMDVEHWRPKGEVDLDPKGKGWGYYWLASEWTNLFPSCIDCNRAREQDDFVNGGKVVLGKANQFPVEDEARRWREYDAVAEEVPRLLDPCKDDPAEHLLFTEEGAVVPRPLADGTQSEKGRKSIQVYALNRTGLVLDRQEVVQLIRQRAATIERLVDLLEVPELDHVRDVILDLLTHEIQALLEFKKPDRPFSALATQLIDELSYDKRLAELEAGGG